jgi:anti-sigma-K factor RskA
MLDDEFRELVTRHGNDLKAFAEAAERLAYLHASRLCNHEARLFHTAGAVAKANVASALAEQFERLAQGEPFSE